jgi:hypothetical protein
MMAEKLPSKNRGVRSTHLTEKYGEGDVDAICYF